MANETELVASAMVKLAAIKRQRAAAPPTPPPPAAPPVFDGLYEAASVLGWYDADRLKPTEPVRDDARDRLVAGSITVLDDHGRLRLCLPADTRVAVLRQLRELHAVDRALELNAGEPGDTLHRLLRRHLTIAEPPLDELPLAELHSTAMVCDWLRSAGFPTQDAEPLVRRTAWLTLLAPFEHLAGEHFRGRVKELAWLRAYAGVLPPGGPVASRAVPLGPGPTLPLLVFGPGGVGKSTLVARFILEHARALEQDQFPFVYLDFDRPDVDAAEPLSLLIEALRQLAIEYPAIGSRAAGIREDWLAALKKPYGAIRARSGAAADFGRLVSSIGASGRPAVFVLDTFEEVQWRSREYVSQILTLLADVGKYVRRLRVVIAGRGEIPGVLVDPLPLTGLDQDAAVGFLLAHGIPDAHVAAQIATKVGGDPQNLKLAIRDYLASQQEDRGSLTEFFDQLDQGMIRHKLHDRVLDHIHNSEVRRLAHPGLVLRRLTPDLILDVLAGPCSLSVTTLPEAEHLFGELARETALVKIDSDGALIHRPELRKTILSLVEKEQPLHSEQIHRGAVNFYARRSPSSIERAEEIYHRLKLDQPRDTIMDRWVHGIENRLINAVDEFDGARHAFLAAQLELEVSEQVRQSAALADWERLIGPRVRTLIDNGELAAAISLTDERLDRTPASELVELEAEALVTLGRHETAWMILSSAVDRAEQFGLLDHAVRLLRFEAEIMITWEHWSWSGPITDGLSRLAAQSGKPAHRLAAEAVARAAVLSSPDPPAGDAAALRNALDAVDDAELSGDPALGALAGCPLRDPEDAPRFRRILGLIGYPRYDPSMLRRLAGQIAQFDRSQDYAVSRRYGLATKKSGTEAWGEHLIQAPVPEATATILRLLDDYGTRLPSDVITAGADALASSLAAWHWYPAVDPDAPPLATSSGDEPPPDTSAEPALSPKAHAELVESLARIFTGDTLRVFLRLTQNLSMDSLVPGGTPLVAAIEIVVNYLAREGALTNVLASAREVAPSDSGLLDIAQEIGLSTLPSANPAKQVLQGSSLSPGDWREKLGRIENQVCRIEQRGAPQLTGFLVGENLVLTANLLAADHFDLECRFDVRETTGGSVISSGTVFRVREVVASAPVDEPGLGFALLMVEGSPGVQPVGGSTATTDIPRGWFEVGWAPDPEIDAGLVMVAHNQGLALTLAMESQGVVGFSDDRTRIYHRLNTQAGSSGAPIFDDELNLIALHIGGSDEGSGHGVLFRSIRDRLNGLGVGYLFGTTLA